MQYIKSFSRITREDYDTVGYMASDLALILENNFRIPLTFVVATSAFHSFLERNGLKNKLIKLYHEVGTQEQLSEAYELVKKMFLEAEIPEDFEEELFETYHSVGGSMNGFSASNIIKENANPAVMLVKSPSYILEEDDLSGIFLNVKGENKLLKAVKLCWASLFSPESAGYRISNSITFPENCGIIVQQFLTKGKNALATVYNKTIEVEAYLGIMDSHDELKKDKFLVDREYLQIIENEVKFQQYRISISEGKLVRIPLKQEGNEQKLNDKEIMEAARTAKRITNYLGKNSIVNMTLLNEQFMVNLVQRRTNPEPVEVEEITKQEEKLVERMDEEVGMFEEKPEGEVSETEITMEFDEEKEEPELEFVSLEEEFHQRKIPVEEKEEIFPKVEVYEEESFEEEIIEPEERIIEPVEEIYEEKHADIYEEPEIEDFIMPLNKEIYEEKEVPKPIVEESRIMEHIRFDASSIVIKIYKELLDNITRKYTKTFGIPPESFGEGVRELSNRINISEQDIMEIKRLRDKYVNNSRALTSKEMIFVMEASNKAFNALAK